VLQGVSSRNFRDTCLPITVFAAELDLDAADLRRGLYLSVIWNITYDLRCVGREQLLEGWILVYGLSR
jgi:hypothetical protein